MPRRAAPDISAMLDVLTESMSTRAIAAETQLSQAYVVQLRLGDRGRVRPSYDTVASIERLHQKVIAARTRTP